MRAVAAAGERRVDGGAVRGVDVGAASWSGDVDSSAVRGVDAGAMRGVDAGAVRGVDAGVVSWGGDDVPAALDLAVRRNARTLHAACAELLPGYTAASREPWRQAVLTAGCLSPSASSRGVRRSVPPLIVEEVVQPSDVLCALWLARRSGLFSPGSACGDAVGRRSAGEIVPAFAVDVCAERRDAVWAALRANAAWRAHRAARASVAV